MRRKHVKTSKIVLLIITIIVFFFLILPILVVIPLSFGSADYLQFPPTGFSLRWYDAFLSAPKWVTGLIHSIEIAIVATVAALILGTLAAFGIIKLKGGVRSTFYTFFISPMVIPAIVMAVAAYFFFARIGILRTVPSLMITHTVIGIPYVITNVVAALQGYDRTLERAAASMGANPIVTFLKVTLPCIRPGMFSGALFAFVTSFDEVIISKFIAPTGYKTLPVLMFENIKNEYSPILAAIATVFILIVSIILVSTQLASNRRLTKRGQLK